MGNENYLELLQLGIMPGYSIEAVMISLGHNLRMDQDKEDVNILDLVYQQLLIPSNIASFWTGFETGDGRHCSALVVLSLNLVLVNIGGGVNEPKDIALWSF